MATDVDVQYFSHLNGLTLGNNWGDLIRLLDKALVTGLDFTQITAASIDEQGDVHITLYSAHQAMLLQIVELSGFMPNELNQKYRIKGVLSATELILKPHTAITETAITTIGAGKLASLGYEIIFRDTNNVKRVYRAKNPTAQHPFIRVDESIASDTGSYTTTYAKYAMVGLLEHMEHIDDYQDPDVLQLPFDSANPAKNWKITGTGTNVVRGWSRWYWAKTWHASNDVTSDGITNRNFTLSGSRDAFYLLRAPDSNAQNNKTILGCGLYDGVIEGSTVPNWFLMTRMLTNAASVSFWINDAPDGVPLMRADAFGGFYTNKLSVSLSAHAIARGILPDYLSGRGKFNANLVSCVTVPFYDTDGFLRGTLPHIGYSGNLTTEFITTPKVAGGAMYVVDTAYTYGPNDLVGSFYFYLGGLDQ